MKSNRQVEIGRMLRGKIPALILLLLLLLSRSAGAQGVIHLNAGDSYLFSQPTFTGFQFNETSVFVVVRVSFNGDLFDPGESLRIDLLTSPTSVNSLATGVASNSASITLTS